MFKFPFLSSEYFLICVGLVCVDINSASEKYVYSINAFFSNVSAACKINQMAQFVPCGSFLEIVLPDHLKCFLQ